MRRFTPKPPRAYGQSLLEFALILPILLLITYGIIEFGRAMFVYTAANTAVREASRYAAAAGNNDEGIPYYQDCKGIRETAQHFAFFARVQDIKIEYDKGSPDSTFAECPPDTDRSNVVLEAGDRVHVTLTVAYKPLFLFNTNRVDFTFDSAHTVVKNVVLNTTGSGGSTTGGGNTPPPPTPTPAPTPTPTPCIGFFCW